jgi:hypothetical protein
MGPTLAADHYHPGVTVTELADSSLAYHAGYLTTMFGIPVVGLAHPDAALLPAATRKLSH